ncbi:MAG: hypothetical protein ABSF27_00205 [Candidatus Dormibacteria bacterium]|jgi:hypothetical protein
MKRDEVRENGDSYFPTYEELAAELLEGLERASLIVQDVAHEIEPSSGERTFHATVRLPASEPPHRYAATVHFHWDALLTYVGAYGPGSECELYHDEEEVCGHRRSSARPFVEVVVEYDLGDGGYQLSELTELQSWIGTVNGLLSRAVPDQEGRAVRVGLVLREGGMWVDRFYAEQAWYLDLSEPPQVDPACRVIASTLKATPALADRLPL